jgi:translation initiation factor 3 subunit C
MREFIDRMRKKMNINDFVTLQTDFDDLNKELEKGLKIFEKEGGIPRFYIRTLCEIENYVMSLSNEDKKKLS